MTFAREFFEFLRARKKFWMWPLLVVIALLAALLVLVEGSPAAPFIYTLF
jgi:hypothetical protein